MMYSVKFDSNIVVRTTSDKIARQALRTTIDILSWTKSSGCIDYLLEDSYGQSQYQGGRFDRANSWNKIWPNTKEKQQNR